jgi:uncharacterized protein (DUF2267 family)
MGPRLPEALESTLQKTLHWLQAVRREARLEDEKQAYVVLRAVLHTLRDRLPMMEALQLGAQMPMLIRGMYFEGWRPELSGFPHFSSDRFLRKVEDQIHIRIEFDTLEVTQAVFRVMAEMISLGEIQEVIHCLPTRLKELWPEEILTTHPRRKENGPQPPGTSRGALI